jgi:2-iminobutanoate/2-iminopropanoate deaminase
MYVERAVIFIEKIHTDKAPKAIGSYSQGIISGDRVYTSGQIAMNPETGSMVEGGIIPETEQVLKNLEAVLQAAGASLQTVVKATCFIADMAEFAAFNDTYSRFFTNAPARSCVAVRELPRGARVEIELVAEIPSQD